MMLNKRFAFIKEEEVHDEFGYEIVETIGTVFKCHSTPVKSELILKEQGLLTEKGLRLITKEKVDPDESLTLKNMKTNQKYRVVESLNYDNSPFIIFLLEVV